MNGVLLQGKKYNPPFFHKQILFMGNLWSDPKEERRAQRRVIQRQIWHIDLQIKHIGRQQKEKKRVFIEAVRKKKGKVTLQALGRARHLMELDVAGLITLQSQFQTIHTELSNADNTDLLFDTLKSTNKVLKRTNKTHKSTHTAKMTQEFESLISALGIKQEIMNDALGDIVESKIDQGEVKEAEAAASSTESNYLEEMMAEATVALMPSVPGSSASSAAASSSSRGFSLVGLQHGGG